MSLNLNTTYGSTAAPITANFPYGEPQNSTSPGAFDGFPLEEAWLKDVYATFQRFLIETGKVPSGNPDTVLIGQYFDAIEELIKTNINVSVSGSINMTNYSAIKFLFVTADTTAGDIILSINDVPGANTEQKPVLIFNTIGSNLLKLQATGIGGAGTEFICYSKTTTIITWSTSTYEFMSTDEENKKRSIISADYTIPDYNIINRYKFTTTTQLRICELPLNANKPITISKVDSGIGALKIIPNTGGSDTIDGLNFVLLFSQYDTIKIEKVGTVWKIINSFKPYYYSGWINTNVWTNREFGLVVLPYDNPSAGSILVGEKVTGGTLSSTGIVIYNASSTLVLVNVVGGGGVIFGDDEVLTGNRSGETVDVNLAGGFKNKDSLLQHYFGRNLKNLFFKIFSSTDGSESNSFELHTSNGTGSRGWTLHQNDTDSLKVQTDINGCTYINDSGNAITINTQDWYYNLRLELF